VRWDSIAEDKEEGVDPPCIEKWVLLLDTKSIMPPLLDTPDMPDL
jgi:hypothetical protein